MNFMLLVARATSHSFAALTREILLLPLEHKIHIFSPPCNILYRLINQYSMAGSHCGFKLKDLMKFEKMKMIPAGVECIQCEEELFREIGKPYPL